MGSQPSWPALEHPARAPRRDAVQNYYRILDAARELFAESGADAGTRTSPPGPAWASAPSTAGSPARTPWSMSCVRLATAEINSRR